jgi:DNA-binding beta-propeller fold protein YncE
MSLHLLYSLVLPKHSAPGGFDHAAVHRASQRLYVAHTANHALDVINCAAVQYMHSIPDLAGIAGALVSEERNLVFTSNRNENTVSVFTPNDEAGLVKIPVGIRPNGLAFDPDQHLLLTANVGDPAAQNSFSLSIVDVTKQRMIASIPVPGRTRWAIYDPASQAFYVNIAHPAQIVAVAASDPTHVEQVFDIPSASPHGLDLDPARGRLFCACDTGQLIPVEIATGKIGRPQTLSGTPDVILFNPALQHLYVAVGDPGVIDVFDTRRMRWIETVPTEKGAHTIGFDLDRNRVYAFLPQSHSAWVYQDEL